MNTKHRKGALWLAASVGVVAALVLSGCSAGSASKPSDATTATGNVDTAAAAALPAKYKDAGMIRVAADLPNPPMEMFDKDQKLTGFDYDLAQAMAGKLGVRMEFQKQAFDSAIPSLQSNKHDVIMAGMNDTLERQKVLDFVDYMQSGFSIIVLKGNPEKISNLLDLCGKNVAVQKASVQADILKSYDDQCIAKGSTPITISTLTLETDVQTAVRSGKAVADVVDSPVAAYAAQTAGDGTIFEIVRDPKNPRGYNPVYTGIGLLKKDAKLADALLLALNAVIEDGSYEEILAKYKLSDFNVGKAGINLAS